MSVPSPEGEQNGRHRRSGQPDHPAHGEAFTQQHESQDDGQRRVERGKDHGDGRQLPLGGEQVEPECGRVTRKPGQASAPGRSPSSSTAPSTDNATDATDVTAHTGTTALIAPRLRPRLRRYIAAAPPTPDRAPRGRSVRLTSPAGRMCAPGEHSAGEVDDAVADGRGQCEEGTRWIRGARVGRCDARREGPRRMLGPAPRRAVRPPLPAAGPRRPTPGRGAGIPRAARRSVSRPTGATAPGSPR